MGRSPLHVAISSRNMEAIKLLLEHGVDVGDVSGDGRTALLYAMDEKKFLPIVSALLLRNANPDQWLNRWGLSSSHLPPSIYQEIRNQVVPVQSLMPGLSQWTRDVVGLILNGTIKSIDHRDAFGRTALHYAADIGDATLVDFLLQ